MSFRFPILMKFPHEEYTQNFAESLTFLTDQLDHMIDLAKPLMDIPPLAMLLPLAETPSYYYKAIVKVCNQHQINWLYTADQYQSVYVIDRELNSIIDPLNPDVDSEKITLAHDIDSIRNDNYRPSCVSDAIALVVQSAVNPRNRYGCDVVVIGRGHATKCLCDMLLSLGWTVHQFHSESNVSGMITAITCSQLLINTAPTLDEKVIIALENSFVHHLSYVIDLPGILKSREIELNIARYLGPNIGAITTRLLVYYYLHGGII